MAMESSFVWMNGELVPYERATIHFMTPALHYGVAVFEGIRCYNTVSGPAVFRSHEHAERLLASARILGFRDLPWSVAELMETFRLLVRANQFADCYIRPLIYLTGGGWNLNIDAGQPALAISTWEWKNYLGDEALENGIRANIASFTRHHPNVMMTKAKISGNYANSVLARTESMRQGFEEAILLDPQGYVAECTGENLFLVRKGKIITPPVTAVLEGITRDSLLTIAKDLGYEVIEQMISRDQLYAADEVFVCGTAAEVIALREVDYRTIGSAKMGPVTRHIQTVFHQVVRGDHARSADWLDPVYAPETASETNSKTASPALRLPISEPVDKPR
jgi:branched-chain amino acid aminotransferase